MLESTITPERSYARCSFEIETQISFFFVSISSLARWFGYYPLWVLWILFQHGEDECYLNTIQACAIDVWSDQVRVASGCFGPYLYFQSIYTMCQKISCFWFELTKLFLLMYCTRFRNGISISFAAWSVISPRAGCNRGRSLLCIRKSPQTLQP